FGVGPQPRAVRFIGAEAFERREPISDIVRPFVRHPVAHDLAAVLRDQRQPAARIRLERVALEWVDLVADENGDCHVQPSVRSAESSGIPRRMSRTNASVPAEASSPRSGLEQCARQRGQNPASVRYSSPAARFTVSARMIVLNRKLSRPCIAARRRNLRDVICTSETWNVMPSTREKYMKSR